MSKSYLLVSLFVLVGSVQAAAPKSPSKEEHGALAGKNKQSPKRQNLKDARSASLGGCLRMRPRSLGTLLNPLQKIIAGSLLANLNSAEAEVQQAHPEQNWGQNNSDLERALGKEPAKFNLNPRVHLTPPPEENRSWEK